MDWANSILGLPDTAMCKTGHSWPDTLFQFRILLSITKFIFRVILSTLINTYSSRQQPLWIDNKWIKERLRTISFFVSCKKMLVKLMGEEHTFCDFTLYSKLLVTKLHNLSHKIILFSCRSWTTDKTKRRFKEVTHILLKH